MKHKTQGCHRVVIELAPVDNFKVVMWSGLYL